MLPILIAALFPMQAPASGEASAEFRRRTVYEARFPKGVDRAWVGPDWWACRTQDWRLRDGRAECIEARTRKPVRMLRNLTVATGPMGEGYLCRVRLGTIDEGKARPDMLAGFSIGAGGAGIDFRRTALVHHRPARDGGLVAGVQGDGRLVFRDFETNLSQGGWSIAGPLTGFEFREIPAKERFGGRIPPQSLKNLVLELRVRPDGADWAVELRALTPGTCLELARAVLTDLPERLVTGGFGLVSHLGPEGSGRGFWFREFRLEGDSLALHEDRAFGPILGAMYSLSGKVLHLTAQMPPLGPQDPRQAFLEIHPREDAPWERIAHARLDPDAMTFRFRVEGWPYAHEVPYRVVYALRTSPRRTKRTVFRGRIRSRPRGKDEVVLASLNCVKHFTGGLEWNRNALWFPNEDLVSAVEAHDPDLCFFAGDQIYEGDLTGVERRPFPKARLDYLDKWYRWVWSFRDLVRDRPSVVIPDDHDVYHGNLWGAGGRRARRQDDGGFTMPARFVDLVQRTQSSHLPDPVDPRPTPDGIGVYFTHLEYGGLSFAILEDRKWKDSPTVMVPEGKYRNGWPQAEGFDPSSDRGEKATLLGKRQLAFLEDWVADWGNGTWMKVVLSQTLFSNVATIPAGAKGGQVLPGLPIPEPGEYPSGYKLASDGDSNGWPQAGRDRALRLFRKAFALHLCGDQHLASLVHYGIDEFDDASLAFCAPAIGNTWPRRWFPPKPGENRAPGAPLYTGRFLDGFGNRMTVLAVANPRRWGKEPERLHDRSPGYGIVRFRPKARRIRIECWPRFEDPRREGARQYPGWPVEIDMFANYGRKIRGRLAEIPIPDPEGRVVRVYRRKTKDSPETLLYALRAGPPSFRPFIFDPSQIHRVEVDR